MLFPSKAPCEQNKFLFRILDKNTNRFAKIKKSRVSKEFKLEWQIKHFVLFKSKQSSNIIINLYLQVN